MPRDKRKRPQQKAKQRRLKRYAKAREDVQLNGDIETVPAGAVRDERVDPATQGSQPLPGLIGQAVRKRWAVPDHMAVQQIDELHQIATDPEVDPHVRVAAIRTGVMADQSQWERDNPELAGKVRGGGVKVGVQVNNQQVLTPQMVLDSVLQEARANQSETRKRLDELKRLEQGEPNGPDVRGVPGAAEASGRDDDGGRGELPVGGGDGGS